MPPGFENEGYIFLRKHLSEDRRAQVRAKLESLWRAEGDLASRENYVEPGVRRLANLAAKGHEFRRLMEDQKVLTSVSEVVGQNVRVSMINAREVPPKDKRARQPLHTDTDYSGVPDKAGYYACTAIWMLDDFSKENGAPRLVRGSHHSGVVPRRIIEDLYAPHPEEEFLEGRAGDVVIFNGHCWHGAVENRTSSPRMGVLVHYLRSDIPRPRHRRQKVPPLLLRTLPQSTLTLLGVGDAQRLPLLRYEVKRLAANFESKLKIAKNRLASRKNARSGR